MTWRGEDAEAGVIGAQTTCTISICFRSRSLLTAGCLCTGLSEDWDCARMGVY